MTYEQCLTSLVHKSVLERERREIERKWFYQAVQDMFDCCDTEKKLILDKIVAMEREQSQFKVRVVDESKVY